MDERINNLLEMRAVLLGMITRAFIKEVDEQALNDYREMQNNQDLAESIGGFTVLQDYFKNLPTDPVTDLAVDYARAFLGAGISKGLVAHPYESVYASETKLLYQEQYEDMKKIFAREGFKMGMAEEGSEDHIATQFGYLGSLAAQGMKAYQEGNIEAFVESLKKQKAFVEKHLKNWVPAFAADTQKVARTSFYKGMAELASNFVQEEPSTIDWMIETCQTA